MTRSFALAISFVLFSFLTLNSPAYSQLQPCPSSTERDLDTGRCLPVATVTPALPRPESVPPPSLLDLRQQQSPHTPEATPDAEPSLSTLPRPGGVGGGIEYLQGELEAVNGAELDTTMFVQPGGLQETTNGLTWVFTTATNRTQDTVEVVGIYYEQADSGSLGIFDWSCSSDYPCSSPSAGTAYQPAWIMTTNFSDLSCNITKVKDPIGNSVQAVKYINRTTKIARKGPTWRNTVLLQNFCTHRWDQIWQHQYQGVLEDCSVTNACAWWGPILETFTDGDPSPYIAEVGFEHTVLIHDGIRSQLPASETFFSGVAAPWDLFWLDPNQGYGAGNFAIHPRPKR